MNFGIIGTGMIAEFHYKAISEIPGCAVIACLGTSREKAAAFAEKHTCAPYADMENFLAHTGLEIVTVCTPSGAHRGVALSAARAGKHVIVEKPIEVTLERVDDIIAACRENNVSLAGVFMSRYHAAAMALKKAVDAGRFGRLTLGSAYVKWWRSQEYYDKNAWRGTKKFDGGGALMNQAIHAVDLLQWFMGPVESVRAHTALLGHKRIEVEDTAAASLRFKNGALGVIEGTTAVYPGFPKRVEICGLAGTAVLEEESLTSWQFAREEPNDKDIRAAFSAKVGSGGAADPAAIGYQAHKAQFAEIVGCIAAGKKPLVDGEEARKAVEIILAVYKSAETGKEVKLPL